MKSFLALLLISIPTVHGALADPLYKCQASGRVTYQYMPCQDANLPLTLPEVMTPLVDVDPKFSTSTPPKKSKAKKKSACKFFTSTQLRNMRVKRQFESGLNQKDLKKLLGKADKTSGSENNQVWIYEGERMNYQFKFKKGCMVSWKEKWKTKKKTEIDRYLPNF